MERVVATVSGRGVTADVEAWVRVFTSGCGLVGWEGHFETGGTVFPPGDYVLAAADGRRGRIRVTHIGVSGRHPTRAEFTGSGPIHQPLRPTRR